MIAGVAFGDVQVSVGDSSSVCCSVCRERRVLIPESPRVLGEADGSALFILSSQPLLVLPHGVIVARASRRDRGRVLTGLVAGSSWNGVEYVENRVVAGVPCGLPRLTLDVRVSVRVELHGSARFRVGS
jgi:hypothetical protein